MRASEGIDLVQIVDDALHGWIGREFAFEIGCAHGLAGKANVRDRDRIALTIAAGLLRTRKMRFQSRQRGRMPVVTPLQDACFVDLLFTRKIFAPTRSDQ